VEQAAGALSAADPAAEPLTSRNSTGAALAVDVPAAPTVTDAGGAAEASQSDIGERLQGQDWCGTHMQPASGQDMSLQMVQVLCQA
jgi:hypothetical protein